MTDPIERQAAINALEKKKDKKAKGDIAGFYNKIIQNDIDTLMTLPSAQPDVLDIDDENMINRWAAINEITEYSGGSTLYMSVGELKRRLEDLPPAKKEITLEDVEAYCKPRCLQIVTTDVMMPQLQEEKEIKRLRELAARILGKYEEEKKKQLAAVRLASLRGSERDRAKELQARTEREIENLRKEIKGE